MQAEQVAKKLNDPSFRAKRGIPLALFGSKEEGFLASLGMTMFEVFCTL
jgi:hypothetical protein